MARPTCAIIQRYLGKISGRLMFHRNERWVRMPGDLPPKYPPNSAEVAYNKAPLEYLTSLS
jgi:hypothetical protein